MADSSPAHQSMCVPYTCSFITGASPNTIVQELAKINATGRAKCGWLWAEYRTFLVRNGVVFGTEIVSNSTPTRVHDLFRFGAQHKVDLRRGTWITRVVSHVMVLHNARMYHNQQPTGTDVSGILRNSKLVSLHEVVSPVKAQLPYTSTTHPLALTTTALDDFLNQHQRTGPTQFWRSADGMEGRCVLGGRSLHIKYFKYGRYTLSVNGRPQRTVSGAVGAAYNKLVRYVQQENGGN